MQSGDTTYGEFEFIVVSNRLPVDRVNDDDGNGTWRRSPGGLVTALAPVMEKADGAWVGWHGAADESLESFDHTDIRLVPVPLSADEVEFYYEGFSNATLWPLYHDVIAPPEFHRHWWDSYRRVNERFAAATAAIAAKGATVWVQDYQLQLVPKMLREARPDLKIGFFNHIPFPPLEIYAQLPWRRQVIEGLLGADLIGFQRPSDASNFLRCVRRFLGLSVRQQQVQVKGSEGSPDYVSRAEAFPISIDVQRIVDLANRPDIIERSQEIRRELGNPKHILLGVDRLDYTKGIGHRLKAYEELLADGLVQVEDAALIQVASPSRERVEQYRLLREEVEGAVGRINGTYDTIANTAIRYLHHSYPVEEMVALYLAADVMLVTALRDGMNLVAKEYVAARTGNRGALVLSEFAGAADTLRQAILVNPHDIDGLKSAILAALQMTPSEASRRMRTMRRQVLQNDVERWSKAFLTELQNEARKEPLTESLSPELLSALATAAATDTLLVALDFDGTMSPLVDRAEDARALPGSAAALRELAQLPRTTTALISGRALDSLRLVASPEPGTLLIGSHGAETWTGPDGAPLELTASQAEILRRATDAVQQVVDAHPGTLLELKPAGVVLHTRTADADTAESAASAARSTLSSMEGVHMSDGKNILELSVVQADKGKGLQSLRELTGATAVVFAGDDVTDEHALKTLTAPDVGIKVGDGQTAAHYRIASPEQLVQVLEELVTLRSAGATA